MDDSVTTGDHCSNSEAMDVEPISETVENRIENSINKKCEFPHSSVSTHVVLSLCSMEDLRC